MMTRQIQISTKNFTRSSENLSSISSGLMGLSGSSAASNCGPWTPMVGHLLCTERKKKTRARNLNSTNHLQIPILSTEF